MTGARLRSLQLLAVAAAGSQAGHLIAYRARFGGAALAIESGGAHGYFLPALSWIGSIAGAGAVAALLLIATTRRLSSPRTGGWRVSDCLPLLFVLQLALYGGQESIESLAAGSPPPAALDLMLWGGLGQLPVACAGALALAWMSGRLEASLNAIDTRLGRLWTEVVAAITIRPAAAGPPAAALATTAGRSLSKRGPPPPS